MENDPTVYGTMFGPSEFTITGTLGDWSVVERLPSITAPTLVLSGEYDEARPRRGHRSWSASATYATTSSPAQAASRTSRRPRSSPRSWASSSAGMTDPGCRSPSPGATDPAQQPGAQRLAEFGYRQELRRSMSLTDVVVYGLIYIVPISPLAVFGLIFNFSAGMVGLVFLVAAVAMVFSGLSYREMALHYPIAGSVYSYVRLGLNSFVGFLAGWAILLDYLLLPALASVFSAAAMVSLWSAVPAWAWIIVFVVLAAGVNLGGIAVTATMNKVFLLIQLVVLAIFVVWALSDLVQLRAHLVLWPFFDPDRFSWSIVFGAIPIAALAFIGFDAISTLNEEARGGGRAVAKATIIVLVSVDVSVRAAGVSGRDLRPAGHNLPRRRRHQRRLLRPRRPGRRGLVQSAGHAHLSPDRDLRQLDRLTGDVVPSGVQHGPGPGSSPGSCRR